MSLHDQLVCQRSALGDRAFVRVRALGADELRALMSVEHTAFAWTPAHTESMGALGCVVGGARRTALSVVVFEQPDTTTAAVARIYHDAQLEPVSTAGVSADVCGRLMLGRADIMVAAAGRICVRDGDSITRLLASLAGSARETLHRMLAGDSALGDASFVRVRHVTAEQRRMPTPGGAAPLWVSSMDATQGDLGFVVGGDATRAVSLVVFARPVDTCNKHYFMYHDAHLEHVDEALLNELQRVTLHRAGARLLADTAREALDAGGGGGDSGGGDGDGATVATLRAMLLATTQTMASMASAHAALAARVERLETAAAHTK